MGGGVGDFCQLDDHRRSNTSVKRDSYASTQPVHYSYPCIKTTDGTLKIWKIWRQNCLKIKVQMYAIMSNNRNLGGLETKGCKGTTVSYS